MIALINWSWFELTMPGRITQVLVFFGLMYLIMWMVGKFFE